MRRRISWLSRSLLDLGQFAVDVVQQPELSVDRGTVGLVVDRVQHRLDRGPHALGCHGHEVGCIVGPLAKLLPRGLIGQSDVGVPDIWNRQQG